MTQIENNIPTPEAAEVHANLGSAEAHQQRDPELTLGGIYRVLGQFRHVGKSSHFVKTPVGTTSREYPTSWLRMTD